ncbi:hypothetical protein KIN20_032072 [Parelaphostrongylus tenuis]|uniref:Uncharacterized protein n=1 Tax=Parelaphostrongylus tenuis TaxID=148309 RepID=A0AAD5R607_PARTN|nr:hypothetical protein KIN20_032072 [Parelaphostrongylus tenuis]
MTVFALENTQSAYLRDGEAKLSAAPSSDENVGGTSPYYDRSPGLEYRDTNHLEYITTATILDKSQYDKLTTVNSQLSNNEPSFIPTSYLEKHPNRPPPYQQENMLMKQHSPFPNLYVLRSDKKENIPKYVD